MRHLSVPKRQTQAISEALRERGWYAERIRILADGECTLIPVSDEAPNPLPSPFSTIPIVDEERKVPTQPTNWLDSLKRFISPDVIAEYSGVWPSAQEHFGDLILFKIDNSIKQYAQQVALAKLHFSKHSRLVLLDDGVEGAYRVRNLRPLALRMDEEILNASEIANLPQPEREQLTATRTRIVENGVHLHVDPSKAYYSVRLARERERTVDAAKQLAKRLGRPLNIADPYCGVGPAVTQLLHEQDLVSTVLASDLNPDAIPLLLDNLTAKKLITTKRSLKTLTRTADGHYVGLADALTLCGNQQLQGRFDLLLMNLPHDTMQHLPHLLPLLSTDNPALLRGWVVLDEKEIPLQEERLAEMISKLNPIQPKPPLVIRRQFNATKVLTRFEVILGLA